MTLPPATTALPRPDMAHLISQAKDQGVTLTTAESCTGGLVSAAITDIAGSSAVFERGFVTYSNAAKEQMLGVQADTLRRFGAVSEEVAQQMSTGALQAAQAAIAIAVTGIAGPGGSDHKPEGRVCFGLARLNQPTLLQTVEFGPLGREAVRAASCAHALALLAQALSAPAPK